MQTIEVAGISAGLGAMSLAKQLRRINEYTATQKGVIKAAQGLKSFPGLKKQAIGTVMMQKSRDPGSGPNKSYALQHGAKKLGVSV